MHERVYLLNKLLLWAPKSLWLVLGKDFLFSYVSSTATYRVNMNASSKECNRLHNMVTQHTWENLPVSPGPFPHSACGSWYEAITT